MYCFGDIEDYEISKVETNSLYSKLSVYPNPTKDILTIKGLKYTDYTIKIYTSDGRLVSTTVACNKPEVLINCSQFQKAIYFVKINSAEASEIIRFVKFIPQN